MRWNIKQPLDKLVSALKKELKASEIIAKVFANQGIESIDSSKDFFDPNIDQLHDPFMMKHMDIAANQNIKNIQDEISI